MNAGGLGNVRLRPLIAGMVTLLPGLAGIVTRRTGGTSSARYCYSVWLRHLAMAAANGLGANPKCVAELGPGDSLGVGICALLSGADSYCAFDAVAHSRSSASEALVDTLVDLLRRRENIPGDGEFPEIKPRLEDTGFPANILTRERLERALAPERVARIRASIRGGDMIRYYAPWQDAPPELAGSVDLFLSQAVLEHVDDLREIYDVMARCLSSGGTMSHQIDFRSHGTAREWNGHWALSEPLWRLVRGRRPYLLNREPLSTHLRLLEAFGFRVTGRKTVTAASPLDRAELASRFRDLSAEDLTTSGAFIQAVRA